MTGIMCEELVHEQQVVSECTNRRIQVPFASAEHAQIAKRVIDVDAELQPHSVRRTLSTEENMLVA
jgi:hypothetical protein